MKNKKQKAPCDKLADRVESILRDYDNPTQDIIKLYNLLDAVRKEITTFNPTDYV